MFETGTGDMYGTYGAGGGIGDAVEGGLTLAESLFRAVAPLEPGQTSIPLCVAMLAPGVALAGA